uniref:Uncharacterized protein n=1 Tax=Romanomermis culicivorax TaxID=13658 RepID=A0A915IML5_ROMCU
KNLTKLPDHFLGPGPEPDILKILDPERDPKRKIAGDYEAAKNAALKDFEV